MRSRVNLPALCERALAESMDAHAITRIAKELMPNYDIYERTGYPPSMVIPGLEVAHRVVDDIVRSGKLYDLIGFLINAQESGLRGRVYTIPNLRAILHAAAGKGFVYDTENKLFVENPSVRKTRNWGVLKEGTDYTIAFLKLDIVGNSDLVRRYPMTLIRRAYGALREMTVKATERRNGRIWLWEGDGGLAAFFFANKHQAAALAAIEIMHELHLYNQLSCPLASPLTIRIAVHSGLCEYTENGEVLSQNSTLKTLVDMEEHHTKPQTITISSVIKVMLDAIVANQFAPIVDDSQGSYFAYSLQWEP